MMNYIGGIRKRLEVYLLILKEKGARKKELINLTKIYLKNQDRNKRLKTTYIFS